MKRLLVAGCWLLVLVPRPAVAAPDARGDVIVVISVDQFRFDYLERFGPFFGERGFKRLEREGLTYTNARQRHSVTSTGPGHAAIGSGTLPSQNGIIANRWLDRRAGVDVEAWRRYFAETTSAPFDPHGAQWWKSGGSPRFAGTSDASALIAGCSERRHPAGRSAGFQPASTREGRDPRESVPAGCRRSGRLEGGAPNGGDTRKIISLALTDRAAILMGGHEADAAYWFDGRAERFVSSASYDANPDVLAFNDLVKGYMPASAQWNRLPLDLAEVTFDPPAAWPLKNTTYGGTFPHPIPTVRALQFTPFAHDLVLDFALHVLSLEDPDLLFLGISSTDYLGHLYGPDSLEVADSAIRLDRALGAFLDALQRRYGAKVLVALTSDHGIQSIPEIAKLRDHNADAGRIDLRAPPPNARTVRDLSPQRIAIERATARRLGRPFSLDTPLEDAFVFFFEEQTLYLNEPFRTARVKRAVRDAVRELEGVAGAWTDTDTLPPLVRNSFHVQRSGDVLLTLRPGWIWMWGSNSTTHGQPVEADLHVPLLFWGAGVMPGRVDTEAAPVDVRRIVRSIVGVRYPAPTR